MPTESVSDLTGLVRLQVLGGLDPNDFVLIRQGDLFLYNFELIIDTGHELELLVGSGIDALVFGVPRECHGTLVGCLGKKGFERFMVTERRDM